METVTIPAWLNQPQGFIVPGLYQISLWGFSFKPNSAGNYDIVKATSVPIDIIPAAPTTAFLRVKTISNFNTQAPVAGANVRVWMRRLDSFPWQTPVDYMTGADGYTPLSVLPLDQQYKIEVTAAGYQLYTSGALTPPDFIGATANQTVVLNP